MRVCVCVCVCVRACFLSSTCLVCHRLCLSTTCLPATDQVEVQNGDIAADILAVLTHVCRARNPALRVQREVGGRVVAQALVELGVLDPLEVILISSRGNPYAGGSSHGAGSVTPRSPGDGTAVDAYHHHHVSQHIPLTTTLELLYRLSMCPENRVEMLSRGRIIRELFVHIKRTTEKQKRILQEQAVRAAKQHHTSGGGGGADGGHYRGGGSALHSNSDAEAQLYIGGLFANTMKARSAVVLAATPATPATPQLAAAVGVGVGGNGGSPTTRRMVQRRSSDTILIRRLDAQKESELLLNLLWLAQYPARQNTEVCNHALEALSILAEDCINWRFYRRTLELPCVTYCAVVQL